jgi:hypothetical protein
MLIMADVTSEMGAELRASAMAAGTSVAAEVGRRLERLERLEATVEAGSNVDGLGSVHPVRYREVPDGIDDTATNALMRRYRDKEMFRGR